MGVRDGYRLMQWHAAMDGPWSSVAERRFVEEGYDGLVLVAGRDWTPRSLDFLRDLPGIRLFSFRARLKNDVAAFTADTLEDLTLVTGSTLGIPDVTQARLTRLCLTDRPGIQVGRRWPSLEWLRVGTFRGVDLGMVAGASALRSVHLEGRRQSGSLDGLEACRSIESLTLTNYAVDRTDPLRNLPSLTELKLLSARPGPPHSVLDLSHVAGPVLTKLWVSNASGLANLEALVTSSRLREVRLIGCALSETDRRFLSSLPRRIDVQIVDS